MPVTESQAVAQQPPSRELNMIEKVGWNVNKSDRLILRFYFS